MCSRDEGNGTAWDAQCNHKQRLDELDHMSDHAVKVFI